MIKLWEREPVALMAVLRQAIVLATAFGLKLTPEQCVALYGFVEVVTALITRSQVTPAPKDPPKPPSAGKAVGSVVGALVALVLLVGCGAAQEPPPCDAASYAALSAGCGDDLAECRRQIHERETFCAKQIQEGP